MMEAAAKFTLAGKTIAGAAAKSSIGSRFLTGFLY